MSFAGTNPCRVILEDPLLRNKESLEDLIFSDGDQFVFQNMKDKIEHGQVFAQNKEKILSLLEKQGTQVAPASSESTDENVYVILGGESRLGRIAQKVWSLYGVKVFVDFERLQDAAGSYSIYRRSITVGLEEILYPNQLSKTLWHEVIHARNGFESLVHVLIDDRVGGDNPYPSFYLDELIAYEKNLKHLKNINLFSQRVEGERRNIHLRRYSFEEILKDLSRRTLAKKQELLSLLEHLRALENNPNVSFQKLYQTLEFRDLYFKAKSQITVFESNYLEDSLGSVPSRYVDLYPNLKEHYFKGTPEEYRKLFLRRTRYSINLIIKVLEIAEKHAGESL